MPECGGAQRDERVHEVIAAHPLHEVATDQASHGVPDDMHLLVSCLIAHLRDQIPQAGCHRSDVIGPGGVVERVRRAESATVQTPAQQGEDRTIVKNAVNQHDGRPRGDDVAYQESALCGRQALE